MKQTFLSVAVFATALLSPVLVQAQSTHSSTINLTGNVSEGCAIGAPADAIVLFGDLTGNDGRIATGLPARTTVINSAWCNIPGTLSVTVSPLALKNAPTGYATPAGFSRKLVYDLTVTGWQTPVSTRSKADPLLVSSQPGTAPFAASQLLLQFSNLVALNGAGVESSAAVLEAGEYEGNVVLKLAAN